MDIIDRISEVCNDKKIKPAYLHQQGVAASQTVYDVLKKKQKPGINFISKFLALFPDVNGDWLLRGEGQKYFNDKPLTGNKDNTASYNIENISLEEVGEMNGQYVSRVKDLITRIIELEAKLEEKEKFITQLIEQLKK